MNDKPFIKSVLANKPAWADMQIEFWDRLGLSCIMSGRRSNYVASLKSGTSRRASHRRRGPGGNACLLQARRTHE